MEAMASLMSAGLPSEALTAREKSWVTYSCLWTDSQSTAHEQIVTTRESRNLLSGRGTTGLRTWEASLHLASFLLDSPEARVLVQGKRVLELGAGSGFLSMLCATHLGASHVIATDGDAMVLEELRTNLFYNQVENRVATGVMRWGGSLQGSIVEHETDELALDLIIGADVVRIAVWRF